MCLVLIFYLQAEDGIRVAHEGREFRRVLFRSPGGRGVDAGADRTVEHPVDTQGCTGRTSPGRILGRYRSATRLRGGPGQMNKSLLALSVAATMLLCGPASHDADVVPVNFDDPDEGYSTEERRVGNERMSTWR